MIETVIKTWKTLHVRNGIVDDKYRDSWFGWLPIYTDDQAIEMSMGSVVDKAKRFMKNVINEYGKPTSIAVNNNVIHYDDRFYFEVKFLIDISYHDDLFMLEYTVVYHY